VSERLSPCGDSRTITPFLAKGDCDASTGGHSGLRSFFQANLPFTVAGLRRILTGLPPTDRSVIRVTPADFAHFVLSTIIHTL